MDTVESTVPPDETPAAECRFCGRPFPEPEQLTLHRGIEHFGRLTDAEREAYADAYAAERGEIRRFRIEALGVLVVVYFGLLLTYVVITG